MINFLVYNPTSGEIVRSGQCLAESLVQQGSYALETSILHTDSTSYVSSGAPVLYTNLQASNKKLRPTYQCSWSNTTMSWIDARTLTQIKDDKWALIKESRANVDYTPIVVGVYTYDADEISRARIQNTIQLMLLSDPPTASVSWTLANNSVVTITRAQLIAVGMAIWSRTVDVFNQGQVLRDGVYAAADQSSVDAVGLVLNNT